MFTSDRFGSLRSDGAQMQRPLWTSTGTKNPNYPDTMYVTSLIGPNTVNTMTLETIEAFRDHGTVDCTAIRQGSDEAPRVRDESGAVGINLKTVTDQLTAEGVQKFSASMHSLLETIVARQGTLAGG